jgi:predicted MFS family arabinose efflux permease
LVMPELISRFSFRTLMVSGLLLLGVPALLYGGTPNIAELLLLTAIRGVGAGIVTVIWTILVVRYNANPARRGNDFGFFSMATGLIAVVGAPAGLILLGAIGLPSLGMLAGIVSLSGAVIAFATVVEPERLTADSVLGLVLSDWRRLSPPVIAFTATMAGFAVVTSFLPPWSSHLAAPGLLLVGAGSALSRLVTGRITDRLTPDSLLLPGLTTSAAGMLVIAIAVNTHNESGLLVGCFCFGAGAGSLVVSSYLTLLRVPGLSLHAAVASLWNAVYDAGLVVGGLVFSPFAAAFGYTWTFTVAAAMLLGLVPVFWAYRRRHKVHTPQASIQNP